MGIRSSAPNKLEEAFAAAFQQYFVGDPDFVRPLGDGGSIFVAAQSVNTLTYPQVCFMCLDAVEQIALTAIYFGQLHIIVDTALTERSDDFPSLLNLHQTRLDKVLNLLDNVPVLMSLTNAPAAGQSDLRAVRDFRLYGVGTITGEKHGRQNNRLTSMVEVNIPFQPI